MFVQLFWIPLTSQKTREHKSQLFAVRLTEKAPASFGAFPVTNFRALT
jgi:hypothetical protein